MLHNQNLRIEDAWKDSNPRYFIGIRTLLFEGKESHLIKLGLSGAQLSLRGYIAERLMGVGALKIACKLSETETDFVMRATGLIREGCNFTIE